MSSHKKIRFGVLGCSRVAKRSVLPALAASPYAELRLVASRSVESAEACAKEYGSQASTFEEILANVDIDAVYISLPNSLHAQWVIRAAEAGKHVWCEKPAALSYENAERMVAAARKKNVRLMEGFMFLSHPQHAKVREMIDAGILGDLLTFEGCFAVPMPAASSTILEKDLGGGCFYDAGMYPIAASRMIFGEEPKSVACTLVMDPHTGVDVRADMMLTYLGGRSAHISAAFGSYFRSTYGVLGTEAHLTAARAYAVPKDRVTILLLNKNDVIQEITIEPADHFQIMLDDFCEEIALGSASTKKYEEDLLAQARILDAGLLSHRERRFVNISEIE